MNPRAAINDLLPFQGEPLRPAWVLLQIALPIAFKSSKSPKAKNIITHFNFYCQVLFYFPLNKRREWDSNPRALADKRFSRPPRYDHFDISPCAAYSPFIFALRSAQDVFYHQLFGMSIQKISFYQFFCIYFPQAQFLPQIHPKLCRHVSTKSEKLPQAIDPPES